MGDLAENKEFQMHVIKIADASYTQIIEAVNLFCEEENSHFRHSVLISVASTMLLQSVLQPALEHDVDHATIKIMLRDILATIRARASNILDRKSHEKK